MRLVYGQVEQEGNQHRYADQGMPVGAKPFRRLLVKQLVDEGETAVQQQHAGAESQYPKPGNCGRARGQKKHQSPSYGTKTQVEEVDARLDQPQIIHYRLHGIHVDRRRDCDAQLMLLFQHGEMRRADESA